MPCCLRHLAIRVAPSTSLMPFLLVFQARDYALMARPRKGFAGSARHLAVLHDAHARTRRLLVHGGSQLPQPRDSAIFGFQPGCQNRKLRPAKLDPKVQVAMQSS